MSSPRVLVVSMYQGHRCAEMMRALYPLKKEGFIEGVDLLESRNEQETPYDISMVVDEVFQRNDPEPKAFSEEEILAFGQDLETVLSSRNYSTIIPLSDMGVLVLGQATGKFPINFLDPKVISFFQDKASTHHFFEEYELGRTPPFFRTVSLDEPFTEDCSFPLFMKPVRPLCGGGVDAKIVNSGEEVSKLLQQSRYTQFLLTSVLSPPEHNHTVVVNDEGKIVNQGTYHSTDDPDVREPIFSEELNELGTRFGWALSQKFERKIAGVYNIDFLVDQQGPVISEVNPGRFPLNFGALVSKEFNMVADLVRTHWHGPRYVSPFQSYPLTPYNRHSRTSID